MYSASELSNNPFLTTQSNPHARYPDINAIDGAGPSAQYNISASAPGGGYAYQGVYAGQGYLGQQQGQQQQWPQYQQLQPSFGGWAAGADQYGAVSTGMGVGFAASPPGTGMGMGTQMTGVMYGASGGYGMQQQQQQQQQQQVYQQQHAQQQQQGYATGYVGSPPVQPAMMTGYPGGYGPQGQAQAQRPMAYLSEFDPYGSISAPQQQSAPTGALNSPPAPSASAQGLFNGQTHPREYIRTHKLELERWDGYSWKQALNAFDALRGAWERRKEQVGSYYMAPLDKARLQREAEQNIDVVAAASIQMQEVFSGYRHSGDLASKSRVRESLNAALQGLPDWPQN